jgi:hypothetical protein
VHRPDANQIGTRMNLPYLTGWIGFWSFFKLYCRSRFFH